MSSFYRISMFCNKQQKLQIESLMGRSNDDYDNEWSKFVEEDSLEFVNALDLFIDLISDNLEALSKIGITTDMITFWYVYAYEGQCNMEFGPELTKRIGDLGVTLCISCWEK